MNRILRTQPGITPETFVFASPRWLIVGFRSLLFVTGAATAVLCAQHWPAMPLFARFLAALIAPSLLVGSAWHQPWIYTTRFIANESGMYFPVYPPLTLSKKNPQVEIEWLGVPWKHIANIRVATESGESGKCIAFDIQASPIEKSRFFEAVGVPRDRNDQLPATVHAAYSGWPPSPLRAAQKLHYLSLRSEV